MATLTEDCQIRKVIDKLAHSAERVPIPKTTWFFVDFLELPSGQYRLVAEVAAARFVDVRMDPGARFKVARQAVKNAMDAQEEAEAASLVTKAQAQAVAAAKASSPKKPKVTKRAHLSLVS